jgi:hypothetical protein
MNTALNDFNRRAAESLPLYWDTVNAARGNAQSGSNSLAPKMTATPGGLMPLNSVMGPGGAMLPVSGESSQMMGGLVPFGGFRAMGGPVMPGRAYVVGERGPELIMPAGPGMVVPNAATTGSRIGRSPMNRPYAEMPGSGGSLANRPTRAIGRSANDPQRASEMAARQMRSRGDFAGAANVLQRNALFDARLNGMPPSAPAASMPAPMAPPVPGGRLVPGRSAGSMVWQADAPPSLPASGDLMPGLAPAPQRLPLPADTAPAPLPMPEPLNPLQLDPLGNYVNPQPMTPPGFGAMNQAKGLPPPPPGLYGAEAPPPVDVARLPGTDYVAPIFNGKVSAQTLPMKQPDAPLTLEPVPGTNIMLPRGAGADRVPIMENRGTIESPRPSADTMGPMPGMPDLRPLNRNGGAPKPPSGIQYTYDDNGRVTGGFYPRWDEAKGTFVITTMDMDGNGVISAKEKAAAVGASAAAPAPVSTSSGKFKFSLAK